jgi:hypothetical protein
LVERREASISGDGRFVTFIRPFNELYVRDRQTPQRLAVLANVSVSSPKLSADDGRFLSFNRALSEKV